MDVPASDIIIDNSDLHSLTGLAPHQLPELGAQGVRFNAVELKMDIVT